MPNRGPDDELLAGALAGANDCPPLEELERLLNEGAPAPLSRHVVRCSRCQIELQMLRAFTSSEVAEHEKAAVSLIAARLKSRSPEILRPQAAVEEHRSRWKSMLGLRWLAPAAATAAAVLLVAGIAVQLRQGKRPSLGARISDTQVRRSSSIAILSPTGDLREKPPEIHWEAARGVARYRVRIMEVDRAELWNAETTGTRIDIPASVADLIVPAKTLLVQVAAFDADGAKIAESELVRFRFLQKVYTQ